jgi:threonine dehydratase
MVQSVSRTVEKSQAQHNAISSYANVEGIIPSIDANGRISMPGFSSGLSVETYLPLVHLYTRILEASRILDRYRVRLRYHASGCSAGQDQSPLTPLQPSRLVPHLYYKREDLTATRAYKVRGALVAMAKAMENAESERFIAVSTGNHAMGILKAAELLRPASVRIVAPRNTASWKLEKISKKVESLNQANVRAELLLRGDTFDEARSWVLEVQSGKADEAYLDPYSHPWVVAGQGTLGLELLKQLAPLLEEHLYEAVTIISPVGGGGLLTGTATAFKLSGAWEPRLRNVDANFVGLRLSEPDAPLGDAIRVAEVAPCNVQLMQAVQVSLQGMSNEQMAQGVRFVQNDLGATVEGASGGAVLPALPGNAHSASARHLVVSILSGANVG